MTSFPSTPSPDPTEPALSDPDSPAPSRFPEKLSPERVALLRDWVECTARPYKEIARQLGISPSTISRYVAQGGWKRPDGAAPAPRIACPNPEPSRQRTNATPPPQAPDPASNPAPAPPPARRNAPQAAPAVPARRREQIVDRLWTLAERHAAILETQPIERAERSLQPLARLTRTLGEIDKHRHVAPEPGTYAIDAPKPRRSLNELRDELAAHLERIQREEGFGWEVREWWFEGGGGI
ncbi:hypothetical protein KBI52_21715 [Microvirga sp. HBU67558]|uniref:hypothetical protein n=1 Tax=Microvirga TaxID=186650 RepID=UPI001B38EC41|nr:MULTISPECIES: hypothetical protein [unclassified Microvirga]MBQ0822809.1 hypothetical protein [Microvirga sp. HBU67558]